VSYGNQRVGRDFPGALEHSSQSGCVVRQGLQVVRHLRACSIHCLKQTALEADSFRFSL
jgi:hypothetical protein